MTIPELSSEARPGLAPGVRLTLRQGARPLGRAGAGAGAGAGRDGAGDPAALQRSQPRCDAIVDELATAYSADRSEIEHDVKDLLASLIEKRIVTA